MKSEHASHISEAILDILWFFQSISHILKRPLLVFSVIFDDFLRDGGNSTTNVSHFEALPT